MNTGKSCFIEFSKYESREKTISENDSTIMFESKLFIDGLSLERIESTKILGVTIDKNLNWEEHRAKLMKQDIFNFINQENCNKGAKPDYMTINPFDAICKIWYKFHESHEKQFTYKYLTYTFLAVLLYIGGINRCIDRKVKSVSGIY